MHGKLLLKTILWIIGRARERIFIYNQRYNQNVCMSVIPWRVCCLILLTHLSSTHAWAHPSEANWITISEWLKWELWTENDEKKIGPHFDDMAIRSVVEESIRNVWLEQRTRQNLLWLLLMIVFDYVLSFNCFYHWMINTFTMK